MNPKIDIRDICRLLFISTLKPYFHFGSRSQKNIWANLVWIASRGNYFWQDWISLWIGFKCNFWVWACYS